MNDFDFPFLVLAFAMTIYMCRYITCFQQKSQLFGGDDNHREDFDQDT